MKLTKTTKRTPRPKTLLEEIEALKDETFTLELNGLDLAALAIISYRVGGANIIREVFKELGAKIALSAPEISAYREINSDLCKQFKPQTRGLYFNGKNPE